MNIDLFSHVIVRPFQTFGIVHPFFDLHFDTLMYTWIGMGILFCLSYVVRWKLAQNKITPFTCLIEQILTFFSDLSVESLGFFHFKYFAFATALFFFTLICNLMSLLPFCDEPTKDLNTALALGLSSFIFVQSSIIKEIGFINYLKEFTKPMILVAPIEIISKLASIVSMSFRLFGNILGGAIIYLILVQAVGVYKEYYMIAVFALFGLYLVIANSINLENYPLLNQLMQACLGIVFFMTGLQMFFGVFEGMIQAFVLTMLTISYLSLAIANGPRKEEVAS